MTDERALSLIVWAVVGVLALFVVVPLAQFVLLKLIAAEVPKDPLGILNQWRLP